MRAPPVDAVDEIVFDVAFIDMPVPAVKNLTTPAVSFHPMMAFAFGSERLAPVPPSAKARSVIPEIEPPVIVTLLEFCVAIVPRPRVVRCAAASASSIRFAPAVEIVTFDADISRVLFAVAPVVSVRIVLAVRLEPTAMDKVLDPSASRTPRLDALATTVTLESAAFEMLPPVMLTLFEFWLAMVPLIRRASVPST
jgi:hypothetical protein